MSLPTNTLGKMALQKDTESGLTPTQTVGESYAPPPASRITDLLELFKLRVTLMVVLTAWAGYYFAAQKSVLPELTIHLVWTLLGVALVSGGAGAINQVLERAGDLLMSRTRNRPIPSNRMTVLTATILGWAAIAGGCLLLALTSNWLTGLLALATALTYCFIYTPLKTTGPISTFVGAFPGAVPPLLGWTAVRGELEWEALFLFAIVFFWQFPHFLAIAWLYRDDYEKAGIRMLPVVDRSGDETVRQILVYGALLIPVSVAPFLLSMSGPVYPAGAILLGIAYFYFGWRLAMLKLPPTAAESKGHARQLLRASVIYLPLLLGLMVAESVMQ